jgi:triosephosphate isomerase
MRKIVIAGNWKMYKDVDEAKQLVTDLKQKVSGIKSTGIIVCPPAVNLTSVTELIKGSNISLGAQNIYWENEGAFTGEISANMAKSAGAEYVIIGHSERRQYFGETDETVNKRLNSALSVGLKPIVCIGETLEERESGITKDVVKTQLTGALQGISAESMAKIILAYEPVWAIGTGKTASPDQAQDVHAFIREILNDLYGESVSSATVIQYGGSVKPENAKELLGQTDIDGALVGGACLKADSFSEIITIAESL